MNLKHLFATVAAQLTRDREAKGSIPAANTYI